MDHFKRNFKLARSYLTEYPDSGLEQGTIVRFFRASDGGASDYDTLKSARVCVSITTDPNGGGRFFVVYRDDLIEQ